MNRRKGSKSATGKSTVSHQKPVNIGSPITKLLGHPPIVAHQPPPALPGRSEPEAILSQQLSSATSLHTSEDGLPSPSEANSTPTSRYDTVPNLSDCEDVKYERRNCMPGVSYKTLAGKEQWTPVVKRKRIKQRVCEDTDSDSSGSEVDISCSRLVEYQKCTWLEDLSKRTSCMDTNCFQD